MKTKIKENKIVNLNYSLLDKFSELFLTVTKTDLNKKENDKEQEIKRIKKLVLEKTKKH